MKTEHKNYDSKIVLGTISEETLYITVSSELLLYFGYIFNYNINDWLVLVQKIDVFTILINTYIISIVFFIL